MATSTPSGSSRAPATSRSRSPAIGSGGVTHFWERECSIQRQRQKLIEIAPAPGLGVRVRERNPRAAVALARAAGLDNLATVEFLVDADGGEDAAFAFIEANPRLQVEHTVTEEVTGLDLVRLQFDLAAGRTLAARGWARARCPGRAGWRCRCASTWRRWRSDGTARPGGRDAHRVRAAVGAGHPRRHLRICRLPDQPAVRFAARQADRLLVARPASADVAAKAYRALCELKIAGVPTNASVPPEPCCVIRTLLAGRLHTGFVEDHIGELLGPDAAAHRRLFFEAGGLIAAPRRPGRSGRPLAVLALGKSTPGSSDDVAADAPEVPDTGRGRGRR
jgi:pyruvate carboxylase